MDSGAPSTSRTKRVQNLLQTLKELLGDDAHILGYLPKHVVVAPEDGGDGYVPYRIHFGTMREAQSVQTEVYVYMLKSSHLKELPDIRLRGRHPLGTVRQYRLETVLSEGQVHGTFVTVKDLTASAIKSLLQYLFMAQGATFPTDCAMSVSFIACIRTIGYRYKNVATEITHGSADKSLAGRKNETNVPLDKLPVGLEPEVSAAPRAITKTACKRSHASLSGASLMDDDSADATSQSMSSRRSSTEQTHDADKESARHEYRTYLNLHEQLSNVNADLTLINGKTIDTESERIARLIALTDQIDTTLQAKHSSENLKLHNAHKAEKHALVQKLEKKQAKEQNALFADHKHECELARQEHFNAKTAFQKEECALLEEKNAKLRERDELEADRERQRTVLIAMPGWWSVLDEQLTEFQVKRTRMDTDNVNGEGEGV